ncbi:hypothetical protein LTR97_001218 [Elasticomyces elasticus]|uniref:Uncharacterized protein n=1 Tax=Elasticomyces elasticus TaxID=574655 RepID=A0AAN7WHQ5_9PEZI|nr:hypothetical protein LTR97_001218 [Elasticomyces elasticus]
MPTVTTQLAYAVAVNVANLAACVKGEARFRRVADTLRLCNVLGQGDEAHVTRLPKELVDMIEDELTADKILTREHRLKELKQMYECFLENCSPYHDHFSSEQKLDLVNWVREGEGLPSLGSLDEEGVDEAVEDIIDFNDDRELDFWQEEHYKNVADWPNVVGKIEEPGDYGTFTRTRDFVLKHYGLEVFVAYKRVHGEVIVTEAYLILPNEVGIQKGTVRVGSCQKGDNLCDNSPTEDCSAREITIRPMPSAADSARFFSMLTSLGTPDWLAKGDEEEEKKLRERATPKLMMLTRIIDHGGGPQ